MSSAEDEAGPFGASPPPTEAPPTEAPSTQPRPKRRRRRAARPSAQNVNPPVHPANAENQQRETHLETRSHKRTIKVDDRIEGRLIKLGLSHITKVKHVNVDMPLLKAMVEFWRPETHTFHFPVGEMTVTLQDVAFLYGLRSTGIPVRSNTRGPWEEKIRANLYPHEDLGDWHRESSSREGDVVGNNIKLKWLRQNCGVAPQAGATDEELDRYTRAVALELFGTLMFPDISQNSVPAYYLELVSGNLNEVPDFNWGGATLACLYRALDRASMRFKVVTGPWMLLLFWAWSYLPVCRPEVAPIGGLGQPNLDSCVPFGKKWDEARSFSRSQHRGAVENARDYLAVLNVEDVNWFPYVLDRAVMPRVAQEGSIAEHVRLPLIFYHIVAYYYPDRCRHQFGLYQFTPPPLPVSWDVTQNLLGFQHGTYRDRPDFATIFASAHAEWTDEALQARQLETRSWSATDTLRYFRWFWRYGASERPTPREDAEARLQRTQQLPLAQRQYTNMGSRLRNTGNSALKNALHALGLVVKKGCRRVGKAILANCRSQLHDASIPLRLEDLLEQRGLPTNIEDIPDSGDESSSARPTVPTDLQAEDLMHADGRLNTGRLDDILGPRTFFPTQFPASGPTPSMHSASASTS
ncbi:Serine/threonine-protein phosphatase 7 long form-like protein [Rhynchospora pubera]|uniref:Serine/threonine-protein phosphatase 7 long form-like protein n=1 Tax=Rhynchospora pubera TaxID=906938 RepID=A0AAV8DM18_9POAL|nr:Serine/threonine-protein phosphatase 7 long form-like protein [Rhynchospora pubera]